MLYGISPLAQKKEVERYCFKECGKIQIGAITVCDGEFCPCRIDDCPHEDKCTEIIGDIHGKSVKIRKLLPIPK